MYTVIFTACLDMHAETKAELLALKSETQALKTKIRQMEASMGSKIASIEKALMHGTNKTWSVNMHKPRPGWAGIRVSFALCCIALTSR